MNGNKSNLAKARDVILGCVTLALSIAYLVIAQQIKTRPKMVPSYANSRIVPTLLGIVLLVLSILLIAQGLRNMRQPADEAAEKKLGRMDILSITLTFAVMLLYAVTLPYLGFILATILYLFLQFIILAPKEKRNLPLFAVIAVGFTALVFVAFRVGLSQMLPRGPIESLLGF